MLTIFTIPKPFEGYINTIQRNAIKSWKRLSCQPQIILFGDDKGVKEAAQEFGAGHVSEIRKNQFGTPILGSAFSITKDKSSNEILVYVNADIILTEDLVEAIKLIDTSRPFLMSGRRLDVEVREEIDFSGTDWEEMLSSKSVMHGYAGMDYFVFRKDNSFNLPDFAVGRPGWDNWFVYYVKSKNIKVIDATSAVRIFHQNHESINKDKKAENSRNISLAGGLSEMCTLREADLLLTKEGLKKPPFWRVILGKLALFGPWQFLLSIKRKLLR